MTPKGFSRTLKVLDVTLATVCPKIEITPEIAAMLPYDANENLVWFYVEAGLEKLHGKISQNSGTASKGLSTESNTITEVGQEGARAPPQSDEPETKAKLEWSG